jgi:hypothetical protein
LRIIVLNVSTRFSPPRRRAICRAVANNLYRSSLGACWFILGYSSNRQHSRRIALHQPRLDSLPPHLQRYWRLGDILSATFEFKVRFKTVGGYPSSSYTQLSHQALKHLDTSCHFCPGLVVHKRFAPRNVHRSQYTVRQG